MAYNNLPANPTVMDWRDAWVDALRSGDFQQAQFALKSGDAYDVMGVLVAVYILWASQNGGSETFFRGNVLIDNGQEFMAQWPSSIPSGTVLLAQTWGGFTDQDGNSQSLRDLNDTGSTFAQLADLIESNPDGLWS